MPAFEPEGCVSWDVVLPDRDAPRYGWRPLKAKVMLETCDGEETCLLYTSPSPRDCS